MKQAGSGPFVPQTVHPQMCCSNSHPLSDSQHSNLIDSILNSICMCLCVCVCASTQKHMSLQSTLTYNIGIFCANFVIPMSTVSYLSIMISAWVQVFQKRHPGWKVLPVPLWYGSDSAGWYQLWWIQWWAIICFVLATSAEHQHTCTVC